MAGGRIAPGKWCLIFKYILKPISSFPRVALLPGLFANKASGAAQGRALWANRTMPLVGKRGGMMG